MESVAVSRAALDGPAVAVSISPGMGHHGPEFDVGRDGSQRDIAGDRVAEGAQEIVTEAAGSKAGKSARRGFIALKNAIFIVFFRRFRRVLVCF